MDENKNIEFENKEKTDEYIKQKLDNEVSQMFENALFMKRAESKVLRMIDRQVEVSVANADLNRLIGDLVKQHIHDNLKDIIRQVIHIQVEYINKKLSREHEVAKQLSYSIHAEIKHVLMDSPISHVAEKQIMDKIISELNNIKIQNKELDDDKILQLVKQ